MAESTERGASQQVGIILLFGLVIIGAALVIGVGMIALDSIETQASAERGEQAMLQFDNDLQTAMLDNTSGSVYLEDGEYNLSDGGDIQITAVNEYAERSETISMGTIRYEDDAGNVFAHQAGGVWRGEGDDARVVSKPDIRYYEEPNGTDDTNGRLDISVANLSGNVEAGENRVTTRSGSDGDGMDLTRDLGFVNYVKITVSDSPYHNAWADFLRDEFNASGGDCNPSGTPIETTVCHHEDSQEVTVIAPIEGDNPFASHVGIEPTIYGGLYTEGNGMTLDNPVTVDRYNSSAGWSDDDNVTEDLLVVNDGFDLGADTNVTGVPVVNGEFESHDDANLSNIAFATEPGGERMDVINGTEVYNVTESDPARMFGAKMSRPFDEIDDIDQETDRAIGLIQDYEDSEDLTGSLGAGSNETKFYYSGSDATITDKKINTGDNGSIHVAVDGDLTLTDVEINGGGQVYFYVSEKIKATNVTIEEKRARNLWIYGTSGSEVIVNDEFHGVIYVPESNLTFNDAEIYGSVVGGEVDDITGELDINFDKTLRTDIPIPEENRDVTVEIDKRRAPLDVTFVLDRSGSMRWNDGGNQRIDATQKFIGMLEGSESELLKGNQSDQAGVYKFNMNGYERHYLSDELSEVNMSVWPEIGGNTNMSAGMVPALDEYENNGSDTADRHMVLLSDGQNTEQVCTDTGFFGGCRNYEDTNADYLTKQQAKRASNMSVTVHTIGLSDEADEVLLENVSNKTGGDYYPAGDDDELEEIFEGIASNVTASSPTTFEVASMDEPTTSPNDYSVEVTEESVTIGKD